MVPAISSSVPKRRAGMKSGWSSPSVSGVREAKTDSVISEAKSGGKGGRGGGGAMR